MWIAVVMGMVTASSTANAGPVRCSVNNQDSTCVGHLTTAWQTAPTCPNQPGWTTIASAQWIGSQYSAPQCNYQAAPTCPSGYDQVGPSWNGNSWVGLSCTPRSPPDPTAGCMANLPAGWTITGQTSNTRNMTFPAGISGLFFTGTGDTWVDKCGTTHVNTVLICEVRTADSGFVTWAQDVNYNVGSCGH
ncbi:hypothetical protein GGD68_007074 [Paraburkholderia fungorum]|nr:hypothetical protein [Paraburkholderia fungorum]